MNLKLLKTFLKIILKKNMNQYLLILLQIILTYAAIAVIMVFIDRIMYLNSSITVPDMEELYIDFRVVIISGGAALIMSRYLSMMKASMRDYCILKTLGATIYNIKALVWVQILCLVIITIPVGLLAGYILSNMILELLGSFSAHSRSKQLIISFDTFYIIAGAALVIILFMGIYMEAGIRKTSISTMILKGNNICEELEAE